MFGFKKFLRRKRKKVASRSRKAGEVNTKLIGIDEVGGLKGGEERNYAIVSATISDRLAFEQIVREVAAKNGVTTELSYTSQRPLRVVMLDSISPLIEDVRYVYAYRPNGYEFQKRPKILHKQLLEELARDLDLKRGEDVLIVADHNSMISDCKVKTIFIPDGQTRDMECVVLPSRYFYELQGHDFIAGAIGADLNQGDPRYVDALERNGISPKGRQVHFRLRRADGSY